MWLDDQTPFEQFVDDWLATREMLGLSYDGDVTKEPEVEQHTNAHHTYTHTHTHTHTHTLKHTYTGAAAHVQDHEKDHQRAPGSRRS